MAATEAAVMALDPAVAANQQFVKQLFGALMKASAASNSLPTSHEFKFNATIPAFEKWMKKSGSRVLGLSRKVAGHLWNRDPLSLRTLDDLLENFDEAVDIQVIYRNKKYRVLWGTSLRLPIPITISGAPASRSQGNGF